MKYIYFVNILRFLTRREIKGGVFRVKQDQLTKRRVCMCSLFGYLNSVGQGKMLNTLLQKLICVAIDVWIETEAVQYLNVTYPHEAQSQPLFRCEFW